MSSVFSHVRSKLTEACSAVRGRLGRILPPGSQKDPGSEGLRHYFEKLPHPGINRADADIPTEPPAPIDLNQFNARTRIGREPDGDSWRSFLIVEVCGTIQAPDEGHEVDLEIALSDVTDRGEAPLPVLSRPKQGPAKRSSVFVYRTEMGKLCHQTTVLEDWTTVARICPDWFILPRQGRRQLQYAAAILSRQTHERLAATTCVGSFENLETGYLDVEENFQRAKTLAVGLAFSVGAANNELRDTEVNVISGWVRTNFGSADVSAAARMELQRALQKTAAFFRKGGRINTEDICREIVEIAPLGGRLEILDLCLRVAGAKGQVTIAELTLLKDMAEWLEVGRARLRAMVEKVLPVHMHQTQDAEMILGVTDEMSREQARQQLNREYAKWSSRVISSDPSIRKQADQMLTLIADARIQYVGAGLSKQP